MNFENFSLIHGEAILFPDSHFQCFTAGETFDSGWTVGTFLTALASFMGCNPIAFVGMDYCYCRNQKYAAGVEGGGQDLVETQTLEGTVVRTQSDWLMAKSWLEAFALKHPDQTFLNATEGGLGFSFPIQNILFSDLRLEEQKKLKEKVHETVASLPFSPKFDWDLWRTSLARCAAIVERGIFSKEENFDGESAYELLLAPLWETWRPVFQRSLAFDPNPEKMTINRLLFFQNVIQEHLYLIGS